MLHGLIGRHKTELPTPCLLLNLDAVDENINKMAKFFSGLECKLRPHAKTHKLPWIAHRQVRAGAIGISCAKLQDAKGFVEAGIQDVLITNEVVGEEKIQELVNLSHLANIMVCVDHIDNAEHISAIARKKGLTLGVLAEIDVGTKRCGVSPGKAALEFVQKISRLEALSFEGLMGYEGALFMMDQQEKTRVCQERNRLLIATKELIEENGFQVAVVTAGGSNTHNITGLCPGITDIQPGSYVTMDAWNAKYGLDFEQAITVLTTVISRPEKKRAVTDGGLKALSTDHGPSLVISHQGVEIEVLNEEHGKLILTDPCPEVAVGDKIEVIPSHGCTTVPLYDRYIAVKDNHVVAGIRMISGGATY